jgi:hypothetical protein
MTATFRIRDLMARSARQLMVTFAFATMTMPMAQVAAQQPFPTPQPGHGIASLTKASLFPQIKYPPWLAGNPPDACKDFLPLRDEAARRGQLIKAARERHASVDEACQLVRNYFRSETKMTEYIEANSTRCGIPSYLADRLRADHKTTEAMQIKICRPAQEPRSLNLGLNKILAPPKNEPKLIGDFVPVR